MTDSPPIVPAPAKTEIPGPPPELIAEEDKLWSEVMADPENDEKHKTYFNFVLRNNLLKEGSRRYGPLIEAKEQVSIEARRQFRRYQQTIVNLMFMTSFQPAPVVKKTPVIWYFILMSAAMMVIGGLVEPKIRWAFFVGLAAIAGFLVFKLRAIRNLRDENKRIPE